MHQSNTRDHKALLGVNLLFIVVNLALLGWGLTHHSEYPQLLGRYSYGYAVLLGCMALIAMAQVWLFCCTSERVISIAGNLYTLVISTVLVLLFVEVMLRVINPWGMEFFHTMPYHMQGMVDHSQLGYVHPRSVGYELGNVHVSLNSKGLRDHEITYAKPAGEGRILALGDSVTFGWGVDQGQTFSERMEPLLKQRTGRAWEVINAGVNGYNSEQEKIYLEIEGLRYDPDIVLLTYVANDTDAVFDPNVATWRRYPDWPPNLPEALQRLRGLSFLFQGTHIITRLRPVADNDHPPRDPAERLSITDLPRWPESKAALESIAATLKQRGIHFLVARNSGNDPRFFQELAEAGITAITLDPAWAHVPSGAEAHVSRIDSHPSGTVHTEMAIEFVDELGRRGWLTPSVDQPTQ